MIRFRARGDEGLPARLEALAEAVELAAGRLDDEAVAMARHVVDKAEGRLRHGTTHTLVALLGATGSGKSSVANLVVGHDVATTGIRRPTTSSTLACIWGDDDASGLLDWLEVANRHQVDPAAAPMGGGAGSGLEPGAWDGMVLLDVPDHDSVALAHREEMERIAEHADVLVWVTDPEKYADKAMHDYLAGLGPHGAVMVLVLNKTDLLPEAEAEACRADLARLAAQAGLGDTPVIALSTATGEGRDQLGQVLAGAVETKQAAVARLAADTEVAAAELRSELGPVAGSRQVPKGVSDQLASDLVEASGLGVVADAVAAGHRRDAARATGWPFTRWVRRLRPHPLGRFHLGQGSTGRASLPEPSGAQRARIQGALREAADEVSRDLPEPWPTHIRAAANPDGDVLSDRIDQALARAVRSGPTRSPRWWSVVGAVQWLLAIAAVTGAIWLALLAFAAYLRIPEPPTPEYQGFPIPTGLLLGGIALGLLVAVVAARLARIGGARRARSVRKQAEAEVSVAATELVVVPVQAELDRRNEMHRLLDRVAG